MKSLPCLVMLALAVGLASAQPAGLSPSPSPGVSPAPSTANKTTPASPGPTSPAPSLRASPLPSLVANVLRSPSPAAGGGVNRSPAPNGAASAASPAPSLKASPLPKPAADVLRSPAPAASAAAGGMKGSPAAARPAPAAATAPANTTNTKVSGYYSSPLYAIQSIPELTELTKLGAGSEVAKLLSNKQLVSTIFAPNNAAVKRAVEFVQNATGADANSLTRSGVIEQLLSYHVAKGAAILLGNFKDNQTLTMLDGNKTTIVKQEAGGPARRLLQAGNVTYFIVSDSNQTIQLSGPANIQGGKSMIHVIDGVLVPKALLDQYNITNTTDLPGANASATSSRVADTTTSRDISPGATTQAPQKSSAASVFFAAQVAVPALLAALWL